MTTINDANWKFLAEETGKPGPFNDMYFRYLRSLGYTGTLQDMIAASGAGINPAAGPPPLPVGYAFLVDPDGNYYVDLDNNYYIDRVT